MAERSNGRETWTGSGEPIAHYFSFLNTLERHVTSGGLANAGDCEPRKRDG